MHPLPMLTLAPKCPWQVLSTLRRSRNSSPRENDSIFQLHGAPQFPRFSNKQCFSLCSRKVGKLPERERESKLFHHNLATTSQPKSRCPHGNTWDPGQTTALHVPTHNLTTLGS
uniref:Uncharacterized protein n=1 Tax=Physcomitrium patens TaxID=3218 RepID=A0A2K1JK97_PHYPA|nr:hypothetical protein PHYPA_016802 [Physcomitrium patens]